MYRITQGDILAWARDYDGEPFHALLCDPPYHLTEMNRRWSGATEDKTSPAVFTRQHRGFMGKTWDGGDIAFRPETWAAVGGLLYPGAFGMAFAGSRGWHRMACAIEDAGLIIHPTIFAWNYLSGFPKATRIDTQVDRRAGAERKRKRPIAVPRRTRNGTLALGGGWQGEPWETAPATELAAAWEGHRYGLQALKPAIEPIIVFQRPYEGRPVDSITATGAGAINVDGGRIGTREPVEWCTCDDDEAQS